MTRFIAVMNPEMVVNYNHVYILHVTIIMQITKSCSPLHVLSMHVKNYTVPVEIPQLVV